MSIKKLGGTRLRLVAGLTAVMAIAGVLYARPFLDMSFSPTSINGGDPATLTLTGLQDNVTYYLVPTQSGSANYEGWQVAASQPMDAATNGYVFDTDESPDALQINGGSPVQTSSGSVTFKLRTSNPDGHQNTNVELRSSPSTTPALDSAAIEIREQ